MAAESHQSGSATSTQAVYYVPPIATRSLSAKIKMFLWKFQVGLKNSVLGLYVAYVLIRGRVWRIGSDPKRKQFRSIDPAKPLKIGVVSEYYFPHTGGLTGDTHYACVVLQKLGHEVKLLTSHVAPEHNIMRSKHGFEIIRIGHSTSFMANGSMAKIAVGLGVVDQVREVMKREKFDLLHIHCPMMPVHMMLYQIEADCPLVGHLHTVFQKKSFWYRLFDSYIKRFWQDYEGLVAVSETAALPFEKEYDIQFKIIPNGIPLHLYKAPKPKVEKFNDGRINIFFIHRLEPRSGVGTAIEAFRLIHKEEPRARLIIAGDGPMRPFFEDSVAPEIKEHVHFIGTVQKEKYQWFETADLHIVPTTRVAALGNTLLESLASGKPTVCSDIPAFRETVVPEVDALMAHVDKPEEFAQQALRIIRDPQLGKRLAENGLRKIEEKYTWDLIVERVDDFSWEILEKIHGPRAVEAKRASRQRAAELKSLRESSSQAAKQAVG